MICFFIHPYEKKNHEFSFYGIYGNLNKLCNYVSALSRGGGGGGGTLNGTELSADS